DERACRGCFMNENEHLLPEILDPVIDGAGITVGQDAEWPVPGFMVVAVREHIGSMGEFDLDTVRRIGLVTHAVRKGMSEQLGLATVHMYQEEKRERPHFHFWLLPLWPDVLTRTGINPRIYDSNIAEYLTWFSFNQEKERIRRCRD